MLVPMLETIRRNINRKQENIRLFEFGRTYHRHGDQPREAEHLAVVMTGRPHDESWRTGDPGQTDFFALKGQVEGLLRRLGIRTWASAPLAPDASWAYGQDLSAGGLSLGRFGRLADNLARSFDVRQPVFMADLLVEPLVALAERQATVVREISRFPAVVRDLAVIVREETAFGDILAVVEEAGGAWLSRTEVFDVYRHDEHVGPGRKSIALRFTLENPDAVLTDKDIDDWFGRVQRAVTGTLGAEIRK
jgi:phenylalanyl-tRNA synthetase beta chain